MRKIPAHTSLETTSKFAYSQLAFFGQVRVRTSHFLDRLVSFAFFY
jgi:hypothetical protein